MIEMGSFHKHGLALFHHECHFLRLFFSFLIIIFISRAEARNAVPAIFVFGDSTVDPGNNNYVGTVFKGNFRPYGRDFPNQVPTGRFSNGRLTTDYIAKYVGIKEYVPPYLDPKLSNEELMSGVSFASAGSGYDPLTPQISNVISLSKQLEYFKEYQKRMEEVIGEKETKSLITKAVYFVSAGTNDYVVNYFAVPIRRSNYTVSTYMDFLLQQVDHFLQGLLEQGARRIGVVGLPLMGCLPIVMTLNSALLLSKRGCVDYYSSVASTHNLMLLPKLNSIQSNPSNSGVRIAYLDIYGPLSDMTLHRWNYDFEEVKRGCCGTGLLEAAFLCNPKSYVCSDASKYLFWDSIHPTEKTYNLIFQKLQSTIDGLIKD